MNMVDRVARALFDASPFRSEEGPFEAQTEVYQRMCRLLARAAIEAMREPSERMLFAADGWTDLVGPYKEANTPEERRREFAIAWGAMIDAALSNTRESDNG